MKENNNGIEGMLVHEDIESFWNTVTEKDPWSDQIANRLAELDRLNKVNNLEYSKIVTKAQIMMTKEEFHELSKKFESKQDDNELWFAEELDKLESYYGNTR